MNLRSGPGLEYAILGQVSAGDQLSALGISAGGQWLQVARDGEGHWIYADLTDIKADQRHRLPKIPAADRAIAAEPSPSVAQVPLSAHLPVGAKVRLGRGTVSVAQYSPAGDYLAVGGGVGTWLYDAHTLEVLSLFAGHTQPVTSVAFSPEGQTLATAAGWDNAVYLWEVATGVRLHTLKGHLGEVTSVAFSPDGRTLASGNTMDGFRLWDTSTGALLHTMSDTPRGHEGIVESVAFSPDGRTLVTGSVDGILRLWDVNTATLQHTLDHTVDGHYSRFVLSVAFTPDGQTLASGDDDGTVHLWNVATGTLQHSLYHQPPKGGGVVVSSVQCGFQSRRTHLGERRQGQNSALVGYGHRQPPAYHGGPHGLGPQRGFQS